MDNVQKIILVTLAPKTHRTSEENLGLLYLAGILRQNKFDVILIDAWLNNYSLEEVYTSITKQDNILFVGMSFYMTNTEPSLKLAQLIRDYNPNIPLVCGGFGPTFFANEYISKGFFDIGCIGEGEETIVEIAKYYFKNKAKKELFKIKGICFSADNSVVFTDRRPLIDNLDSIPFPARDTINIALKNKSTVAICSSRGCSGNCEFCSVISFFRKSCGKVWRGRSIKNIVDELETLYRKGVKFFKFVDDSFIDGKRDEKWCKNFRDEILNRKININMRGQIRADKATESVLRYLREAGFFSFSCGIENGSQTALNRMSKTATIVQNETALKNFKKYNYILQMGFILFDNKTTLKELKENYLFLKKYSWAVNKGIFSEMFSAEGSKFNDKLKHEGKLIETGINSKYKIEDEKVFWIYKALKSWQKSHSVLYDMAVDPLNAPKALEYEKLMEFYKLFKVIKNNDIDLFGEIMETIFDQDCTEHDIDDILRNKILSTKAMYENIYHKLVSLYQKNDLKYIATTNPFI